MSENLVYKNTDLSLFPDKIIFRKNSIFLDKIEGIEQRGFSASITRFVIALALYIPIDMTLRSIFEPDLPYTSPHIPIHSYILALLIMLYGLSLLLQPRWVYARTSSGRVFLFRGSKAEVDDFLHFFYEAKGQANPA